MIEKFGENYAADIKQIIDHKIKSCTKQMVKREENILKLMDIAIIAQKQRLTKTEYQTVYLALVDAICLEYKFYKKAKKGYIALTLLKHGENFWEGTLLLKSFNFFYTMLIYFVSGDFFDHWLHSNDNLLIHILHENEDLQDVGQYELDVARILAAQAILKNQM